jgi:imidazolonepropionase-like amidohydrolase
MTLGLLLATTVVAAPDTAKLTTVIHAGHLITEPGKPVLEKHSVVIQAGRIVSIQGGFVDGDHVIDLSSAWVMPGLIDMHTHVSVAMDLHSDNPVSDFMPAYLGRPSQRVFTALVHARDVLRHGFTTIRNLGDPASVTYDLRNAIDAGIVDGPRIIGTEPQVGVAGGDYSAFLFGEREDLEGLFRSRGTCAGAVDCERVVRDEIRRGAGVIKLRLSAQTVIDPASGPMETAAELTAIISTAHRLNRKVATHSVGTASDNQLAIDAGTDTIEHGPISEGNIAAMAKRGIAFTPTMLAAKTAIDSGKIPMPANSYALLLSSVAKANVAGVTILFGSDLPVANIADTAKEFLLLHEAGLTPEAALRTATVNAATALGMAGSLGTLEAGKQADLIALDHDPLADLAAMASVSFVMKGGVVYRDDLQRQPPHGERPVPAGHAGSRNAGP